MSTPQAPEDTAPSGGRPGRARIATRLLRGRPERRRRRSGAHDRAEGEPEPPFEAEGRSYPSFAPELASS